MVKEYKIGFANIIRRYGRFVCDLERFVPGVDHYPAKVWELKGKYYIIMYHVIFDEFAEDWLETALWKVTAVVGPFRSQEEAEEWYFLQPELIGES
ncbi:MAG: hypothetical protein J7K23_00915 [Thermoproteales archaeon]|nr:hypothetical protein [Thermoproteales archaeon]